MFKGLMDLGAAVSFFAEDIDFQLSNEVEIKRWLLNAISREAKVAGEINYIFCSDAYLHQLNLAHLKHDTLTDIITFNYCVDNEVNADVFISIDRVRDNGRSYEVAFENELSRVMIHGVLHLVGYDDKTVSEKQTMRAKEDFYLSLQ